MYFRYLCLFAFLGLVWPLSLAFHENKNTLPPPSLETYPNCACVFRPLNCMRVVANGYQQLYATLPGFPAEHLRVESAEEADPEDNVRLYWTMLGVDAAWLDELAVLNLRWRSGGPSARGRCTRPTNFDA